MSESKLNVLLLRYTQDPEHIVAQAAKLCYSPSSVAELKEQIDSKDQSVFIEKLTEMGHLSPIEHVSFTFGIEGISRACSHQLVRHRLASYSQQSQRYVGKYSKKTVGFDFVIPPMIEKAGKKQWFIEKMNCIQEWYDELIEALGDSGESTFEDARFLLPNAAETKIIITMNARELLHFFRVRCCNRAQWEIRAMTIEMLRLAKKVAPNILKDAGPGCVNNACPEGKMTCGKMDEVRNMFRNI
ncbi:MAG: FAD-dependent thymidylate synthase [Candidatus Kuenenia stuttgartiensis]|uniref:FAD-dependent thymidylate synthase n=1 Tax=uncultured Candidatus Kuenenia sp. TaxID=1048336 RepID=UPI0002F23B42|nr:FAD-dependent thymidylate synthase [uncultured Candidatus Kuenenia sp.]MBZ0193259.1 FAD-dependent thymidylate synthase [Candidatus Kuenenia stuttgartiensis]GJQ50225.1 MAG: flavin-dependent thymidylate synthase [Candidatus Kuenenia stuttgartiensis]